MHGGNIRELEDVIRMPGGAWPEYVENDSKEALSDLRGSSAILELVQLRTGVGDDTCHYAVQCREDNSHGA